jgi:hypothetical protein
MFYMPEQPLKDITFGFTDFTGWSVEDPKVQSLFEGILINDKKLCAYVRSLGGTVLTTGETVDYRLNSTSEDFKQQVRDMIADIAILRYVDERPFGNMNPSAITDLKKDIDNGNPRLFAYRRSDRGHAKYFIDASEQVEKIEQVGAKYTQQTGDRLYDDFVVRPFIRTPSTYFTSYRVAVGASGENLAAGLLYSRHHQDEHKLIINSCEDTSDERLVFMARHFEDPHSPYFLEAKDVRSNILCGGSMIPLMGNNRQPLKKNEAEILVAHGIDPDNAQPPRDILERSRLIGKLVAPQVDLVLGLDYIQDETDCRLLLEVNGNPTGRAYNICHLGGRADMNDAMHTARLKAIDQIADAELNK